MDKKTFILILNLVLLINFSTSLYPAAELKSAVNKNIGRKDYIIKNPKFTHIEKEKSRLVKVGTIAPGSNEKYFIGFPSSFSLDEDNNLYVYDIFNSSILKFDKNFRFIKTIGSKGNKEGQFSKASTNIYINTGKDGNLYASDPRGKKIISFTGSGKYINEYKVFHPQLAKPVVDQKGNYYMPSINGGLIDVYDRNMKLRTVFLDDKVLNSFLFFDTTPSLYRVNVFPLFTNLERCVISNGRLAIYIYNSSKLYVIKNNKILLEKYLWPKNALALYKAKVLYYRQKENPFAYRNLFISFIIDQDNDSFFYLQFGKDEEKNLNLLYKFDFAGNLVKVLCYKIENNTQHIFKLKKANKFIAVDSNKNINIFKEK